MTERNKARSRIERLAILASSFLAVATLAVGGIHTVRPQGWCEFFPKWPGCIG